MKSSPASFVRRLLGNRRGAVAPLFLLSFTAILGTTLGGVDLVRYNTVQNRLQGALDGATLSAGRNLQNRQMVPGSTDVESWESDAFAYFNSNMPDNYLGNTIKPEDLKISYSDTPAQTDGYATGQFISMQVTGTMPLVSTGFLNISSIQVSAQNRAVRTTPANIELVMALDNTGSMSDDNKIGTLRTAATNLSTILFAAKADADKTDTPRDITIGLVPFADTVNVGNTTYTRKWLYNYPAVQTYFIGNNWLGCISEPLSKYWGGTDLPVAPLTPDAKFMPLHLTYSFTLSGSTLGLTSSQIISPNTADPMPASQYLGPTSSGNYQYDRRVAARRTGDTQFTIYSAANPSTCVASRKSLFLSANQTTVQNSINSMTANGSTIIPTGLLWAWRMLDPEWQGAWDGSDKPQQTDTKTLRKVIVLLTDGMNEPSTGATGYVSNSTRSAFRLTYDVQKCTGNGKKKTCSAAGQNTYTPSGGYQTATISGQGAINSLKMRDPDPSSTDTSTSIGWGNTNAISNATVDNYMSALCSSVKSDGNAIRIYTVTLGDVGGASETRMNNCSSGAGYYYNAQDVASLPEVFSSIASAMVELRLTM